MSAGTRDEPGAAGAAGAGAAPPSGEERARAAAERAPAAAPAGPRFWTTVAALLRKDLRTELRTLESVPAMVLFAVTIFVVFHFGLQRASLSGELAAGVLWVALLLAALLGINRLFVAERDQGGFDGFLLAPADRTALLVAKALALALYLAILEVVAVAAYVVLLLGPPAGPALGGLVAALALADVGIAVLGTLVAALAIQTRARDLIAPLVGLPLLIPLLIAAVKATAPLLSAHPDGPAGSWLGFLALYDLLFALLAYAVFDYLLED